MKEVDFSNFNPNAKGGGGGNGISFLRFERDQTYRLRPFGAAVEFYKIFIAKGKPSIIVDPDDKDKAAKILSEQTGQEIRPSYRNAMFVIDRADGRIKILEGGAQIFEQFANWSAASNLKPGASQAGDWNISVTGDGVGGSNPRKYSAVYVGQALFTDEEKSTITTLKSEGKLKLGNFLKETSLDNILEAAGFAAAAAPAETSSSEPAGVGADNSDDPMDW